MGESLPETAMTKKDSFIIRTSRRSGPSVSSVTLPSGHRVHTLDRGVFDRAVKAAQDYISERKHRDTPIEGGEYPAKHESAG